MPSLPRRSPRTCAAIEEVEVDLLAELAFAAYGVDGHEEKGFEESFGRHAGAAGGAISGFELGMESVQDAIGASFDIAERMVDANSVFDFESMKERQLRIGMSAHRELPAH